MGELTATRGEDIAIAAEAAVVRHGANCPESLAAAMKEELERVGDPVPSDLKAQAIGIVSDFSNQNGEFMLKPEDQNAARQVGGATNGMGRASFNASLER